MQFGAAWHDAISQEWCNTGHCVNVVLCLLGGIWLLCLLNAVQLLVDVHTIARYVMQMQHLLCSAKTRVSSEEFV
jgi:hypothetical protein